MNIFISHSHYDTAISDDIFRQLRQRFADTASHIFYDESELRGGDEWFRRIQHEVIAAPIFIVILSRHSVGSRSLSLIITLV